LTRLKTRPLVLRDKKGPPILVNSSPPVLVNDGSDTPVPNAVFMVSVADKEEKGSDVRNDDR